MATNKRSIGGQGLEQGGANLGNDISSTNNNTTLGGSDVTPMHSMTPEDMDQDDDSNQDDAGGENGDDKNDDEE